MPLSKVTGSDRQRKLVANIEGSQFTADQLADLVPNVMETRMTSGHGNHVPTSHQVTR